MRKKKGRRKRRDLRRIIIPALGIVLVLVALRLASGVFFKQKPDIAGASASGERQEISASGAGGTAERALADAASTGATADSASVYDTTETGRASESDLADASSGSSYDPVTTELEEGRAYLRRLESQSPIDIGQQIVEARKEFQAREQLREYGQKREAYRQQLEKNGVWEAFDDYVFLGDSRVVGFSFYGFLSWDRVLAESGDTIQAIQDRLEAVRSYDPKYIFLSYGINDIGTGLWPSPEEYADAYEDRIDALREALPDAEIYVNSILPVTPQAAEGTSAWRELPSYSEAVRQMCARREIPFIDNDALAEARGDLYEQDGVHLRPDFYYYWAENQLLAIFDLDQGYTTFRDPLRKDLQQ